jgi:hypothetical protein
LRKFSLLSAVEPYRAALNWPAERVF